MGCADNCEGDIPHERPTLLGNPRVRAAMRLLATQGMRILSAGISIAVLNATPVAAQYVEPEVEIKRSTGKDYPHAEEDEPVIVSPTEFSSLQIKAPGSQEIAAIRIIFKGRWHKSADHLAQEKASAMGANCLVRQESIGSEDGGAGAIRTYRAVRLTNLAGLPVYTKPSQEPPASKPAAAAQPPASPSTASPGTPMPSAEAPPAQAQPKVHRHFAWVWERGDHILSHRLGFDASRANKEELEQLRLYVRENFPDREYRRLLQAYKKRSKVVLDFRNWTVR